ncbi:hypothetical protein WKH31_15480 [Metabacillus indicus]|uniref:hypothetical protein n=1 Tax=Metabacillus indicus TaxID=246786 RepID=UPI003177782A
MSDYQEYLAERDKMDYYLGKGWKISSVIENLSGAFLVFKDQDDSEAEMQVKTADGRKYFSAMLIAQAKN